MKLRALRLFVSFVPIYIAGAGIGGLTAALALAQNGTKVEILEKSETLTEMGAGLQLGANAMHVLSALGLQEPIEAVAFEPETIEFRNFETGKSIFSSKVKSFHGVRYGQKYLHIHRADLQNILLTSVKEHNIPLHLGHEITKYKDASDKVHVTTNAGVFEANILVGADGIKSNVRHQMLGEQKNSFTGHVAWRGVIETKKLPPNFIPPCANNWLGSKRHFVAYYIKGGDFINFVAVEERESWAEESWSQKGDMDDLREAFKGWDSRVTTLLEACDECYLWGLFDHPPLPRWAEGRVTLMGDAAHPMLPFLAQGAAMAIEDAWVLAQCIKRSSNPPLALKAFEKARYDRSAFIQKSSRDNAELYHMDSSLETFWRNSKFKIATHIPAAAHSRLDKIFDVDVTKDFPLKA